EDCTESLKFNPQGVKAFYRRAMAREKLNRVDDALKDTEEALRLQPNAEELLALQRRLQALKPKVETPRGFKRMEIVEASEEEEEEEVVAEAKPNEAAIEAPAEPFADIELEHTVAGAEKAKDMGNKLFQEGKIQECERWFSKAIWLVEESGKVSAPDTLRGILHSNRAFARLRMQRWSSAELDCDEALQLNGKNPK
ncbi:RNA polymerase II-associated protein 3, partial [Durusdinium trenchii]